MEEIPRIPRECFSKCIFALILIAEK